MTQQPEFTPRRGSVSSHYEAPVGADNTPSQQPVQGNVGLIVLGAVLVLVGLALLHALYVESLKLGKEASPPADGGTMAMLAMVTLLALVSGSWLILRTSRK